jgi:hypothetical protein
MIRNFHRGLFSKGDPGILPTNGSLTVDSKRKAAEDGAAAAWLAMQP